MCYNQVTRTYAEGSEEPAVLASRVALLEQLLDRLLCVLALRVFLERIGRHSTLEPLQLERVPCREQMRVVDRLATRLEFTSSYSQRNAP